MNIRNTLENLNKSHQKKLEKERSNLNESREKELEEERQRASAKIAEVERKLKEVKRKRNREGGNGDAVSARPLRRLKQDVHFEGESPENPINVE